MMLRRDSIFSDVFFKTRSFPDFQSVVLFIEASTTIRDMFKICGVNVRFVPLPVELDFDPGFIPECLIFDHKTHPQFIREQIENYCPRKVVIVNTHPSKNNLRRFQAVLRESGYGTDVKFAREAARAISPRIRSCLFVLEAGAELMSNSFYSPCDVRPFGQGYPIPPGTGTAADSNAAAELSRIRSSRAYKASLVISKFVLSNKLIFTKALAILLPWRRHNIKRNP